MSVFGDNVNKRISEDDIAKAERLERKCVSRMSEALPHITNGADHSRRGTVPD